MNAQEKKIIADAHNVDVSTLISLNCPCEFGYVNGKKDCEGTEPVSVCSLCWSQSEKYKEPVKSDAVNNPKHYNREGAMECFDEFVEIYGPEAGMYACLFNIHKYRYRAADKNGVEDLHKSDWYMRKFKELKDMT